MASKRCIPTVKAFQQQHTTTATSSTTSSRRPLPALATAVPDAHKRFITGRSLFHSSSSKTFSPLFAISSTDLRRSKTAHTQTQTYWGDQSQNDSGTTTAVAATIAVPTEATFPMDFHQQPLQIIQQDSTLPSQQTLPTPDSCFIESFSNFKNTNSVTSKRILQVRKRQWIERSTAYYSTVMRNESRRARGQIKPSQKTLDYHRRNLVMAKKLYFARNKIKTGALNHAETIYRKLIDELIQEEEDEEECDHAQLAISTLLLALLLQRTNQVVETRKVFNRFFTIIHRHQAENNGHEEECACSAKVLQAYALFEMKQGHVRKAYRLAQMAVKLDPELKPLLKWKQFRDAKELSILNGWVDGC